MKLGLGQIDIVWEEKEQNKKTCSKLMEQAKNCCVDLLIFPEMTLTGFSMNISKIAEQKECSDTVQFFQKEAKKLQLSVGFGVVFKKGEKAANHFVIVDKTGNILADYEKIHPFSFGEESNFYLPGSQIAFCKIQDLKISPLICYDLRFPELFQVCSKKSHLILVIANWPAARQEHWLTLLKARAIENQCYIAGINRIGEGNQLTYQGASSVFDPYGTLISSAPTESGFITAEILPETVEKYQKEFCLKKDRREDLYCQFYQNQF